MLLQYDAVAMLDLYDHEARDQNVFYETTIDLEVQSAGYIKSFSICYGYYTNF